MGGRMTGCWDWDADRVAVGEGVGDDLGRVPFSGSLRGRHGIARSATTVVNLRWDRPKYLPGKSTARRHDIGWGKLFPGGMEC